MVVAVLERLWQQIRLGHGDVPDVVLVLAAGSDGGGRRGLKLGHFAADRWHVERDRRPEVLIGGEGLQRGAREVLGTLLHEAAHGLAHAREVQDTSRQGRYHNRRYKTLAEELGLTVEQAPKLGWSATSVPEATLRRYADLAAQLADVLTLWRRSEQAAARTPSRNLLVCVCDCGRLIRVSASTLEQAPILCGSCGQPFHPCQGIDA